LRRRRRFLDLDVFMRRFSQIDAVQRQEDPEKNPRRRRREEDASYEAFRRRRHLEKNVFKPAESPHNQNGGGKRKSD
jgi:hypothetical protein